MGIGEWLVVSRWWLVEERESRKGESAAPRKWEGWDGTIAAGKVPLGERVAGDDFEDLAAEVGGRVGSGVDQGGGPGFQAGLQVAA